MRLTVVGTGYVGLVAGTCFSNAGNHVTCVDCDESKINRLKKGQIPIYEPGLSELVVRNSRAGRLEFTTDLPSAVADSLLVFIAVGTPPLPDGSADLSAILGVAGEIGRAMDGYRIIVMKSTVPVDTHRHVSEAIKAHTDHDFDYVSNPEFMKEGAAIEDFTRPDRVVIGAKSPAVIEIMKELYAPFMRKRDRIMVMSPASAEITKYAANSMLATRISFMNEIANLCDHFGADVEEVRSGVGSDVRIGNAFLFPGVGYGGSCFPKDVTAMIDMGRKADLPMHITTAVDAVNQVQRQKFADRVLEYIEPRWPGGTIGVWGLAFKANTDDVREAPAIDAIRKFQDRGFKVRAHDPEANGTARQELNDALDVFDDAYEAIAGCDVLVIFTEWAEFRTPDFDLIQERLNNKVIFDGRNLYEPDVLTKRGFTYVCVGRPPVNMA